MHSLPDSAFIIYRLDEKYHYFEKLQPQNVTLPGG